MGIFWRRATSTAALVTLITSSGICYLAQHMKEFFGRGPHPESYAYWLLIAVPACSFVFVLVSLFTKPKEAALLEGLIWTRKDSMALGTHLLQRRDEEAPGAAVVPDGRLALWRDYRLVGLVALLLMAGVIWFFR